MEKYIKEHTNSKFSLKIKKNDGKHKGSSAFIVNVHQPGELVPSITINMTLKDAKTFKNFLDKYLDEAINF